MAALFFQKREIASAPTAVYRPQNPQPFDYYVCAKDHFETFVQVFELSNGYAGMGSGLGN